MDYPLSCDPNAGYVEPDNIWQYREDLDGRSPNVFVTDPSHVDLKLLKLPIREELASSPLRLDSNAGPGSMEWRDVRSAQELNEVLEVSF
jgi:hypothetical protein